MGAQPNDPARFPDQFRADHLRAGTPTIPSVPAETGHHGAVTATATISVCTTASRGASGTWDYVKALK